ncbi:putative LRR receptor serine/threonine-protein kinase [Trifolium repens]|nr:putative LRR receptor serine/threonine-protein kinase [Trifolium repens]
MMRMLLHFLSVLLGVHAILVLIQAQDQSQAGFTSIDCGLPENSDYTEKITGINYKSDADYIDTGVSKSISPAEMITHQQQLHFVRSFPNGMRNCYKINVNIGIKYLVRATFYYGNYDSLNKPPQFELHFGTNVWDIVKFPNASRTIMSEIIYTPSLDYIQPCLVNTGKGTPFISAIELRPMDNEVYVTDQAESAKSVLSLFMRYDLGSITNSEYRYKDDVYDRIWFPYELSSDWRRLSTSLNNDDLNQNDYKLPAIVMSTAITPLNANAPLQFHWDSNNMNDRYYKYLYFNEVEKLAGNETRAFNITMNGVFWFGPKIPIYQKASTVLSTKHFTGAKRYEISLFKTENSTLPPILNAIEVYKLKDFSQSETQHEDVDAVTKIKNSYGVARNWQGDPCAPVMYMWEGLNCSFNGLNPPRIISLNLSSSGLTGQIHYSISQLTMLQYLDLSNNSLDGPLPDFLNNLQFLKYLNVGKNKLKGLVPHELLERSKTDSLSLSVDDNPGLCVTESCRKKSFSVPLIASFSALIFVILLISLGFWLFRRQRVTSTNSKKRGSMKFKRQAFSYTEILNITDNFKTIIGEGGFGKVYLGVLQNDTQVAVKILSPSSMQGYKEFQSEAQLLMIVHHRNLVSLIGFCDEGEIKALIYEYMANGNLQQHLLVGNTNILKWNARLNIAIDAARGLDYLHNGCKPPIMHRDLKPSNILLDENMDAKISDFGLSRAFGSDIDSHISTRPAGTLGYADPEFQRTGNTNKKNDVYSFGIVLFVLITGRQAIVKAAGQNIHILEWVIPIIKGGDIQNVIDSKLEGEFSVDSARKIVEIAMSCISPNFIERPDISQILVELKESLSLDMVQKPEERENDVIESTSSLFQSVTAPFPR